MARWSSRSSPPRAGRASAWPWGLARRGARPSSTRPGRIPSPAARSSIHIRRREKPTQPSARPPRQGAFASRRARGRPLPGLPADRTQRRATRARSPPRWRAPAATTPPGFQLRQRRRPGASISVPPPRPTAEESAPPRSRHRSHQPPPRSHPPTIATGHRGTRPSIHISRLSILRLESVPPLPVATTTGGTSGAAIAPEEHPTDLRNVRPLHSYNYRHQHRRHHHHQRYHQHRRCRHRCHYSHRPHPSPTPITTVTTTPTTTA